MHFLRTLVFSAVFCVSGAFAATIRVAQSECTREKDIEIDFKIHPITKGADVGTSEQLVFPMINSTHIHVILCICPFSILLTSLTTVPDCVGRVCVYDVDCQRYGCQRCVNDRVSIARVLE
jgi:hypothetical protein